ncbi:MAG: ATP-binding protein [Erysipelotrichaceae bacterium]|nr:ATP-binding protein [Erysipelotrichaceae bacterium]
MKDLQAVLNDEYINSFLKENNVSERYALDHLYTLERVSESRKKCESCKGLEECDQSSQGMRLALSYDGGFVEEVEYCPYAIKIVERRRLKNAYVYCDIADEMLDLRLESINYKEDQKKLYLLLAAILYKKSDKGLYICGDLGVGKTYLCSALANSLVLNKEKVAFVKVSNFFNEMKGFFNTDPSMIDVNINRLKKASYLFFDDIGSEAVSEFVRDDILFRILDYRLENKLITIFTSNLNKEELLKHYQYDRKEKANLMNAKRLMERIDILTDNYVLSGTDLRRER